MRTLLRALLGGLAALVALEAIFRVLPVSTATYVGYHIHPEIVTYPPRHRFLASSGWDLRRPNVLRANNYGFLTDSTFAYDPAAIAVIGDSFVEANMHVRSDTVPAILQLLLGGRTPVFAMGGPGSSLLDYATRARWAHDTFGVRKAVIVLERGDVRQALCGSGNVHANCLDSNSLEPRVERAAAPSAAKQLLRQSALAQYLVSQLRFDPAAAVRKGFARGGNGHATGRARSAPDVGREREIAERVVDRFFTQIPDSLDLIFVLDASIRAPGEHSTDDPGFSALVASAMKRRNAVVDLSLPFKEFVARTNLALWISPTDRHWNEIASGIVAQQIAAIIELAPRHALKHDGQSQDGQR